MCVERCNVELTCDFAEQSKVKLMMEMEHRAANSDQVQSLQTNLDTVTAELGDVSAKLHEASVQLSKEKARNKAVVEHTSVSSLLCFVDFSNFTVFTM